MSKNRARPPARTLAWIIVLTVAMTFASVPAQAADGPCAGASVIPPVVYADPECVAPNPSTSQNWEVHPVLDGQDVQISWNFNGTLEGIDEFVLYRGASPSTLYRIGSVDTDEAWTYTDDRGVFGQLATWYAVAALYENGTVDRSPAHLVQPIE